MVQGFTYHSPPKARSTPVSSFAGDRARSLEQERKSMEVWGLGFKGLI